MDEKKRIKIGFVVLHYNTIDETNNCIASIKNKIDTDSYQIVCVDNYSPNKSGMELETLYKKDNKINVILAQSNLGFAKGNNLGFQYLKNNYIADYICVLNNDTEIIQKNFLQIVEKEYKRSEFAVMGPLIILNNDMYQPVSLKIPNYEDTTKSLVILYISYILNKIYMRDFLAHFFSKKEENLYQDKDMLFSRHENIKLHGCCYIFSGKYISKFDGFDSRTFMFYEEELLQLRIVRNDLKSVYNPELKIRHYEDIATDSIYKTSRKKYNFIYSNSIKSLKILRNDLKQYENKGEFYED